ncbi:MAG: hypothetical protein P8177_12710 [Gemmatimonadota bacterium]
MATGAEEARVVRSRKIGSENGIVVQLPAERFEGAIPPHWDPPLDEWGRYRAMLLVQDCERCSFGAGEAGAAHELHLWLQLQLGSASDALPIAGADVSLPSQQWLALLVATDNPMVVANLRSFGFDPARLMYAELRPAGGSIALQGETHLEWAVAGEGRGPATIGIRHALFMPGDKLDAAPHRVAAVISDAVMGQPGELRVQGVSLDPFLLSGERLATSRSGSSMIDSSARAPILTVPS